VWLRADRQTAGKGRQGRAWESPPGNLFASTLIRLRSTDPTPATLALVAAVALEEAVRVFLPSGAMLKWPNDLLIGGAKLSGILLERVGDAVIIGFGVNLAHHPDGLERPVTSLAGQGIEPPDPQLFAETLAESLERWVARWRGEGLAPVRDRWLARAHRAGTALTARLADGSAMDGLFGGLDRDGALILRLADGTSHVIHAADVFLI
jgi:BirA family transcriptional regulator, biotin operon repressor / biotin---[acetyl-CoA-carboxylase] ligase